MTDSITHGPRHPLYESAIYRIRVLGRLEAGWFHTLAGMTVSVKRAEDTGTVSDVMGRLADQAALMGVIEELYGAGFPLLSVQYLGDRTDGVPDSGHSGTG